MEKSDFLTIKQHGSSNAQRQKLLELKNYASSQNVTFIITEFF